MNVAATSFKKPPSHKLENLLGNFSNNFTTLKKLIPQFQKQEKAAFEAAQKQQISAAPGEENSTNNDHEHAWLDRLAAFLKKQKNGTLGRLGNLLDNLLKNHGDIRTKSVVYANLLAVVGNTFTAFTEFLPNSFKLLKKLGGFTGESFRASTFINALGSALIGRKQKDPTYTAAQLGDATQAFGDRSETYFNRAKFIGAYNAADYGKQILQDLKEEGSETQNTKGGEYESYSHGALSLLKVPQKIFSMVSKFGFKETLKNQNIQGFLMNVALMFTPGLKFLTRNSKALDSWLPDLYRNGLSLLGEVAGFSSKNAKKPMWRIARLGFFISTIFAQLAKTPGMPKWAKHMFTSINFAMDSGSKIIAMESRNKGEISDNPHHKELNIFDSFKYTMNTMFSMLTGKDKAEAPVVPIEHAHEIKAQQAAEDMASQVAEVVAPQEEKAEEAPVINIGTAQPAVTRRERRTYRPRFFQPYAFSSTASSSVETSNIQTKETKVKSSVSTTYKKKKKNKAQYSNNKNFKPYNKKRAIETSYQPDGQNSNRVTEYNSKNNSEINTDIKTAV